MPAVGSCSSAPSYALAITFGAYTTGVRIALGLCMAESEHSLLYYAMMTIEQGNSPYSPMSNCCSVPAPRRRDSPSQTRRNRSYQREDRQAAELPIP